MRHERAQDGRQHLAIDFMCYNMGRDASDYARRLRRAEDARAAGVDTERKLRRAYRRANSSAGRAMVAAGCDIFLFQEAGHYGRTVLTDLRATEAYWHFGVPDRPDCVVSLAKRTFRDVENVSRFHAAGDREPRDVAACFCRLRADVATTFVIASVHVPGFRLQGRCVDERRAAVGDGMFADALADVEARASERDADFVVVGGDFNCWPELWPRRFQALSALGYRTVRSYSSTGRPPFDGAPLRELDFVFAKARKFGRATAMRRKDPPFRFSLDDNPSDHVPVAGSIAFAR